MDKYSTLWAWVKADGSDCLKLTFDEIEKIAGLPIDHSFLKYKKNIAEYTVKISLKEKTVCFKKN